MQPVPQREPHRRIAQWKPTVFNFIRPSDPVLGEAGSDAPCLFEPTKVVGPNT